MLFRPEDRDCLNGHLRGIPVLDDQVVVGVDEVAAVGAPEQSPCNHRTLVSKHVPGVELFLKTTLTPGALEGAVEAVESSCFGSKYILVPLNGSQY